MNKPLQLFLILSVALNVLLGGAVLGHFTHKLGMRPGGDITAVIEASSLPEGERKALLQQLKQAAAELGKGREAAREARDASLRILTAEPFNKKAYLASMQRITDIRNDHKARMVETLADIAERLNAQERQALAEALRKPSPRRPAPSKE